jgi:hypothetical protein
VTASGGCHNPSWEQGGEATSVSEQEGLVLETQGVMFDLAFRRPKGQSLAFRMDESWYKVWVDVKAEERSWDDIDCGPIAVLWLFR